MWRSSLSAKSESGSESIPGGSVPAVRGNSRVRDSSSGSSIVGFEPSGSAVTTAARSKAVVTISRRRRSNSAP